MYFISVTNIHKSTRTKIVQSNSSNLHAMEWWWLFAILALRSGCLECLAPEQSRWDHDRDTLAPPHSCTMHCTARSTLNAGRTTCTRANLVHSHPPENAKTLNTIFPITSLDALYKIMAPPDENCQSLEHYNGNALSPNIILRWRGYSRLMKLEQPEGGAAGVAS